MIFGTSSSPNIVFSNEIIQAQEEEDLIQGLVCIKKLLSEDNQVAETCLEGQMRKGIRDKKAVLETRLRGGKKTERNHEG